MNHYDKNKIGRCISWGGDHFVYEYDKNKVIKFSVIEFIYGKDGQARSMHDYSIAKKFFGKYLLETNFVKSQSDKYVASIQDKVIGHYLSKKDLIDDRIRQQFQEIMNCYDLLIRHNHPMIDLIGRGGAFRNFMSNIFVTADKSLVIIDATLLEFNGSGIFKPIFNLICWYANIRQNYLIKNFKQVLDTAPL